MEISAELNKIILTAFQVAKKYSHEYVTPEHLLYASLNFKNPKDIIINSGGNIKLLAKDLEDFFNSDLIPKVKRKKTPEESFGFQSVIAKAVFHAENSQKEFFEFSDVLISIYEEKDLFASYYLKKQGIKKIDILNYISHKISVIDADSYIPEPTKEKEEERHVKNKYLNKFATELVKKAKDGEIDPIIGRNEVIERTIQILARRIKNNPILIGDPGVGKTAIVEALALRIADNKVPKFLKDFKIYSLDLSGLLAGTKYRGDFEDRMRKIIVELKRDKKIILFIDEIHSIVRAGAVEGGSLDASNILKPVIASGEVRCIGTSTYEEYRKYFERDKALSRRFLKVEIDEPSVEDTIKILNGIKQKYEEFHNVIYTDNAIEGAVKLSSKYINDRFLPDKAIDVIDEAGALVNLRAKNDEERKVEIRDIEKVISRIAKIPEKSVSEKETDKLLNIEKELKSVIFGQDKAVSLVCEAIKRSRAGFREPEKPVASFLFVGPTGVGKTELSKQLAKILDIPFIRFDMSEYQEKHTVARLIGAPPGYVGYEEGGLLTESIRKNPHSVLLLDEIEKAHKDIFNSILQIMDYATLTDNAGKKADFRNVIIIMTSNAGTKELGKKKIGFGNEKKDYTDVNKAIEEKFSPEFRNRLDKIVLFNSLNIDIVKMIVNKNLKEFKNQLKEKNIELEIKDNVIDWIAEESFSQEFGAREVARFIQENIKSFFIDRVLFGKLKNGGKVLIGLKNNKPQFSIK